MINDCNIIPSETLFVDDGASNIHIGRKLGFETFQPENGTDWRKGADRDVGKIINGRPRTVFRKSSGADAVVPVSMKT